MPLQAAGSRKLVHMRDVQLRGYLREDGQMEVEAHMTDHKTYSLPNTDRGCIAAGEPLHDMWIRMAVRVEDMEITACEAAIEASPYAICPQTTPKMARLVGLKIGKGFLRAASQAVGGVEGCTHLRELLQPVATVAYQTRYSLLNGHLEGKDAKGGGSPAPNLLNTCHSYAQTSPVMMRMLAEGPQG